MREDVSVGAQPPSQPRQHSRGWQLVQGAHAAQIDAVIALAMAAERAQQEEQPTRLLGWV